MTCFGKIPEYFLKRNQVPQMCGDLLCFRMDSCFNASKLGFRELTHTHINTQIEIKGGPVSELCPELQRILGATSTRHILKNENEREKTNINTEEAEP